MVVVVVVVLVPIRNGDKTATADHHGRRSHPKQHAMPNLRALISLYPLFINTPSTPFPCRMPTTLLLLSSKLRPICGWPCRNNDSSNNNNNGSLSSRCPRAMMFVNSASASAVDEDWEDDVVDDMFGSERFNKFGHQGLRL